MNKGKLHGEYSTHEEKHTH